MPRVFIYLIAILIISTIPINANEERLKEFWNGSAIRVDNWGFYDLETKIPIDLDNLNDVLDLWDGFYELNVRVWKGKVKSHFERTIMIQRPRIMEHFFELLLTLKGIKKGYLPAVPFLKFSEWFEGFEFRDKNDFTWLDDIGILTTNEWVRDVGDYDSRDKSALGKLLGYACYEDVPEYVDIKEKVYLSFYVDPLEAEMSVVSRERIAGVHFVCRQGNLKKNWIDIKGFEHDMDAYLNGVLGMGKVELNLRNGTWN